MTLIKFDGVAILDDDSLNLICICPIQHCPIHCPATWLRIIELNIGLNDIYDEQLQLIALQERFKKHAFTREIAEVRPHHCSVSPKLINRGSNKLVSKTRKRKNRRKA